jgi:hypothetical protein
MKKFFFKLVVLVVAFAIIGPPLSAAGGNSKTAPVKVKSGNIKKK